MVSFHVSELQRALAEQHFGIVTYRIDNEACTDKDAFALVDLLELRQVRVKLSNRGYEVINERQELARDDSQIFETLEDLLQVLSPKYGERRTEELIARLSELAEQDAPHIRSFSEQVEFL